MENKKSVSCSYCKSVFSNNNILNNHKKTAKYCLLIQNNTTSVGNKCDGCEKYFTTKFTYERHLQVCSKNKSFEKYLNEIQRYKDENFKLKEKEDLYCKQIEDYKHQIETLQNKLENIAVKAVNRPTNTNTINNNVLNLAPLDMDDLTERITQVINSKMNESHIIDGQEGVARLVSGCFKTNDGQKLITCTDTSRGIWKSKDANGNIIKDYKAGTIAKVIKPIAISKAIKITDTDTIKRHKINEIKRIRKLRDENIKAEKFDMDCQTAYLKGSDKYNIIEDRIQRRILNQRENDKIEKELVEEFEKNNEMDLLDYTDDDNKPYKIYMGKRDINEMSDDSSKFSNKLAILL